MLDLECHYILGPYELLERSTYSHRCNKLIYRIHCHRTHHIYPVGHRTVKTGLLWVDTLVEIYFDMPIFYLHNVIAKTAEKWLDVVIV